MRSIFTGFFRRRKPALLFFMQLVTDLNLIAPLYKQARALAGGEWETEMYALQDLRAKDPSIAAILEAQGIEAQWVDKKEVEKGRAPELGNVIGIISPTETTAQPHRFAHALALRGRAQKIPT